MEGSDDRPSRIWGQTLLLFGLSVVLFYLQFSRFDLLLDADSYFHMAVARSYGEEGMSGGLPWARFSVMHEGFGDKEFLFHVLLIPFASWLPPELGGALALALLNAGIFALIGHLSLRSIGTYGVFVPFWLYGSSAAFALRTARLRPELLSLLLLLLITWAASRRRYGLVALFSALYALSYTAFQALLGLGIGWTAYVWWIRKELDWRLLASMVAGLACGLLLHPHAPANLEVWRIQNIEWYSYKDILPVGGEVQPSTTKELLQLNLGWLLGLLVFWRSSDRGTESPGPGADDGPARFFLVNAIAFTVLYLSMQRFATYCIPFVTLALFFEIRRRGLRLGRWTSLPGRGRLPFSAALGLCILLAVPTYVEMYRRLHLHGVFNPYISEGWRELGESLPDGAKVASPWEDTEYYVWAAPQGRYLNVLDPLFMAAAHPEPYEVQARIWSNDEVDVPLAVKTSLDSDYLLYGRRTAHLALDGRLQSDPRIEPISRNADVLSRISPQGNRGFVLDWTLLSEDVPLPPTAAIAKEKGRIYPRHPTEAGRAVEGYVDARRMAIEGERLVFVHTEVVEEPCVLTFELAPYGPSTFWIDEREVLTVQSADRASLGSGTLFSLSLERGTHLFTIQTEVQDEMAGFYLLERGRVTATVPRARD